MCRQMNIKHGNCSWKSSELDVFQSKKETFNEVDQGWINQPGLPSQLITPSQVDIVHRQLTNF